MKLSQNRIRPRKEHRQRSGWKWLAVVIGALLLPFAAYTAAQERRAYPDHNYAWEEWFNPRDWYGPEGDDGPAGFFGNYYENYTENYFHDDGVTANEPDYHDYYSGYDDYQDPGFANERYDPYGFERFPNEGHRYNLSLSRRYRYRSERNNYYTEEWYNDDPDFRAWHDD